MATKTIDNCQLELDSEQGVMYVHSPQGTTLVRVRKIPEEISRQLHYNRKDRIWSGCIDIALLPWIGVR